MSPGGWSWLFVACIGSALVSSLVGFALLAMTDGFASGTVIWSSLTASMSSCPRDVAFGLHPGGLVGDMASGTCYGMGAMNGSAGPYVHTRHLHSVFSVSFVTRPGVGSRWSVVVTGSSVNPVVTGASRSDTSATVPA